ncbi:MAG: histidine kinase dimerization/phosphoacceptor domain-containing protein [Nocardioides sp.]
MTDFVSGRRSHTFDVTLALAFLLAGELEVALNTQHGSPVWVDAAAVAVLMGSLAWRRRRPLAVCLVTTGSVAVLALHGDVLALNMPMVVLFVPPYSVARYEPRTRATAGLLVTLMAPLVASLPDPSHGLLGFSLGMPVASWAVGRVTRANRRKAQALHRRAIRAAAEREELQRLTVTDERARIAHELQAVVVASVSEMVVWAEAAQRMLESDPSAADVCMCSIDVTAAQVLTDMRRVLGVLREEHPSATTAPLPGIDQLPALSLTSGRGVHLVVKGTVRSVPASIDLGVYRIAEAALEEADDRPPSQPLELTLSYFPDSVDLTLSIDGGVCVGWPSAPMREWAALCEAEVRPLSTSGIEHLAITIPQPVEAWA